MNSNDKEPKKRLIKSLIKLLDKEKDEGERVGDFEKRINDDVLKVLGIDDLF